MKKKVSIETLIGMPPKRYGIFSRSLESKMSPPRMTREDYESISAAAALTKVTRSTFLWYYAAEAAKQILKGETHDDNGSSIDSTT